MLKGMKWYWIGEKIVNRFKIRLEEGHYFLTKQFIDSLTQKQRKMLIEEEKRQQAKGITMVIFFFIVWLIVLMVVF